jgi:copper resistance protein B
MDGLSHERMMELMDMDDAAPFGLFALDQLEWRTHEGEDVAAVEVQAYYGTDYHKAWLEAELEREQGEESGRVEALWDRIVSPWWSVQAGMRHDLSDGPSRTWAAIGMQGLAPYFFEIDAAFYVGEQGRTAARFAAEYEWLFTQRLILQPEIEVQAFGKDDPENGIASGLADVEIGLRLRYEIRREFAPYVGIHWERKLGNTADLVREAGDDASELQVVAGVRLWF